VLYEELIVWKRLDQRAAVRYRCFRSHATNKYSVQSADFYRLPVDPLQAARLEAQFIELLCESDPAERAGAFDSLKEAIEAHEREFSVP
jgi:hypothetical protein